MADLPPDPDAPLTEDAFDGLDLGTLTDGVHATGAQWGDITTAAARRRQRRTWVIAAAALVVLLLGTSVVVLSRSGSDDGSVSVAAGGTADQQYVVPPAGATDVSITLEGDADYTITYLDSRGASWTLRLTPPVDTALTTIPPIPLDDLLRQVPGQTEVSTGPIGLLHIACTAVTKSASDDATFGLGPTTATWVLGSRFASVSPVIDPRPQCPLPAIADDSLLAAVQSVRVVDAGDFHAYLATIEGGSPGTAGTLVELTTTTTLPDEEPPSAGPGSAEEQIAAAVAGLQDRDADGSYPNLEDGVSRADQYASAFALAAAQSGADQVADPQSGPFTLRDLSFTSSERATITFDAGAHLPSGDYTFAISGNAILQDGRWVLTYDTIAGMVGRACLPPGGVTSVCVKGRND